MNSKTFSNSCLRSFVWLAREKQIKHLYPTTMFTYSHANTPLGQSERAYHFSYFINMLKNMFICLLFCEVSLAPVWVDRYRKELCRDCCCLSPNEGLARGTRVKGGDFLSVFTFRSLLVFVVVFFHCGNNGWKIALQLAVIYVHLDWNGDFEVDWNLNITKGQRTGKMCSLWRDFVISRVFFHIFYYFLVEKIV